MDWENALDREIREKYPAMKTLSMEPMRRHTSFRIGGPAKRMAFPSNREELAELVRLGIKYQARPLIIGNGTNLLCPDEGLDRLVINTSEHMRRIEIIRAGETEESDGARVISADAGVLLRRLAEFACREGLTGLEFAHGIPGSLGGAVCMNAGAYDGEMAGVITQAEIFFTGPAPHGAGGLKLDVKELRFGYRHSLLTEQPDAVVLSANIKLKAGPENQIRAKMRDLMERRKKSQPLDMPSAGSTFKRPAGHFAGTLIERCGLKGLRIGGACVSEKHAGFVVNLGGATCADVENLIAEVRRRVLEETGVELEPEVKIIN